MANTALLKIKNLLSDQTKQTRHNLDDIDRALRTLMDSPHSDEIDAALADLLQKDWTLKLDEKSRFPHSMPPRDHIQFRVAQHLLYKHPEKYKQMLKDLANKSSTHMGFRAHLMGMLGSM